MAGCRRDSSSHPKFQVCIIGDGLKENQQFLKAIEAFDLPFVFSENGQEFLGSEGAKFTTIFVLQEFEGDIFKSLKGQRILGPTTVMQCAEKKTGLPNKIRPLYAISMKGLAITFSGYRDKGELTILADLIHNMGGSVRRDFNVCKTTHLVCSANATFGEKYKYCTSLGIPIMTREWIYKAWEKRHDPSVIATSEEFMTQYKLKPFVECKIALVGYQNEEETHMEEVCLKNGGVIVKGADPSCTHIVVEDGCRIELAEYNTKANFVKNEWFWACIQMEAKAEEELYAFENLPSAVTSSSLILPARGNKRKRFESVAQQVAMESFNESDCFSNNSEYRTISDAVRMSMSGGSFLDATLSPDRSLNLSCDGKEYNRSFIKSPVLDLRNLSPRHQVCLELFQTETNYVGILNTIITVFKEPLEASYNSKKHIGAALLPPADIKQIFGNLPPIFEIHQKIRCELANIIHSWSDNHSIGNLILNHSEGFMKAYPPFVNYFEKTKEVLNNCDQTKPRFHAFLKRCQSRPECGRQTLQELLIRPVQRLPSVILLLGDILKHTSKSCFDHAALESAIQALKNVLMHINEDKRKTEGQVAMFDIVNDVENCPATLLASKRSFKVKADMVEVTDYLLSKKGGIITMFLFNDVLEVCKKRSKATNSTKSPSVINLHAGSVKSQPKSYKHLELIHLHTIINIMDITDTEEIKNYFAITVALSLDENTIKHILYVFILLDENKSAFLQTLARHIANENCKIDIENLITSRHPDELNLQANDTSGSSSSLSKAMYKARDKLGRALSIRKTPTKRGLSRAVSSIMTPLRNFGSSTPSGNISTLRLSSVTNLSEYGSSSSNLSVSPVGGKKMKASSLGVSVAKEM